MAASTVKIWRLLLKTVVLLVLFNAAYYLLQPARWLNRFSLYNSLVPGRARLAFSNDPALSYNLTLSNLSQLISSHEIVRAKASDEFRVVMLGDSSVWGYLLQAQDAQAACLNRLGLRTPDGRRVVVYNLGYPTLTVMKDLLILRRILAYQPDLILWPTTLAAMYPEDQLNFPIILGQYEEVGNLIRQYNFDLAEWATLPAPTWWDRTLPGQRVALSGWLRHQLYGFNWATTGIDHIVPNPRQRPTELAMHEDPISVNIVYLRQARVIVPEDLSFDILRAGINEAKAAGVPTVMVNQPIAIYANSNNPGRYNEFYPRWMYDGYRAAFTQVAANEDWNYHDFWDVVPLDQFTDTDFHQNASSNCAYAAKYLAPLLSATPAKPT
jgi:hypothetical protein